MNKPVLGVLGGIGPLATAYFMKLLVERMPAQSDQEHMPVIAISDPQIPDRTAFILNRLESDPLPEMIRVARELETFGVDYLAMPCNTAHYFYDAIAHAVSIPVLNIVEEMMKAIKDELQAPARVGLMATEGTLASGVYDMWSEPYGIEVVAPNVPAQQVLNKLIYNKVKANQPCDTQEFIDVANGLFAQDCDAVVVGCTELSVIFQGMDKQPRWMYDSLAVLADCCIKKYLEERG